MSKNYPFPKKGWSGTNINTSNVGTYQVKTGAGVLGKIIVGSHTSSSFRLYDGTITGVKTALGGTYTPAAGSAVLPFEIDFDNGLTVTVAGATDSIILYE